MIAGQSGSQLLDRDDELAAIDAVLSRAAAGHGSVVLLYGAAGAGKSALVGVARERARLSGLHVFGARGGELERDHPFGIIRQLYEPVLATAEQSRRARLLAGAAAPAASVLGLPEGGSGVYAAGFSALNAIYWLTVQLASEQALLVVVDDAQWADSSSLRALDYLARRVAELPVALIVALRPDEPGSPADLLDQLRTAPEAIRLSPQPLRQASVARIVRARIASADAATCEACHEATGGNPLYLHELLRSLRTGGPAPDAAEVLRASVPSLGDGVIRRAQRVAEDAPSLARAMAILGDGARLSAAAALASVTDDDAAQIAHRLRRIDVLSAEDPIMFVHPLVRRSVYDAMPDRERQSAHRQAAQLLEEIGARPEAIAGHLQMLPPSCDAAVAEMLLTAAERALDHAAPDEAVDCLERALAEGAPEPARVRLLGRLGEAKAMQRDPAAIAHLRDAFELADDPVLRATLGVTLAEVLTHAGQ